MNQEYQLKQMLSKICNLADRLESQLVTREDGKIESMYTYDSQQVRDDLADAVLEAWELLGEIEGD